MSPSPVQSKVKKGEDAMPHGSSVAVAFELDNAMNWHSFVESLSPPGTVFDLRQLLARVTKRQLLLLALAMSVIGVAIILGFSTAFRAGVTQIVEDQVRASIERATRIDAPSSWTAKNSRGN